MDIPDLKGWIGKTETRCDFTAPTPVHALAATLDRDDPEPKFGDALPPCWHWLYFLPLSRQSEIASDGHGKRGAFLPPVPLPRRMWAGGRLEFFRPLRLGMPVTRTSRIVDVSSKEGRTGPLVFVLLRHEIADPAGVALIEEQDIVYRDNARPQDRAAPARRPPDGPQWTNEIRPDDVLLFRYSALTFNGHRIHYDRRYATEVEGYSGLVVHGPLIATLLLDSLRRHDVHARVARFTFRAVKPLYDIAPFYVCGRRSEPRNTIALWASDAEGFVAMEASVELA